MFWGPGKCSQVSVKVLEARLASQAADMAAMEEAGEAERQDAIDRLHCLQATVAEQARHP